MSLILESSCEHKISKQLSSPKALCSKRQPEAAECVFSHQDRAVDPHKGTDTQHCFCNALKGECKRNGTCSCHTMHFSQSSTIFRLICCVPGSMFAISASHLSQKQVDLVERLCFYFPLSNTLLILYTAYPSSSLSKCFQKRSNDASELVYPWPRAGKAEQSHQVHDFSERLC